MHCLLQLASALLWPRPPGAPAAYTSEEVNESASLWGAPHTHPIAFAAAQALQQQHTASVKFCADEVPGKLISTGAWCLTHRVAGARGVLRFPGRSISYPIPAHHQPASPRIVHALSRLLHTGETMGDGTSSYLALNDFGAGVGQYGAALKAIEPSIAWRGYDGAGNVEAWTNGTVGWFDLTIPLSLPRADWLMALEVAEHVPVVSEGLFLRNLHAHNCKGIILSWAVPKQHGHGHVNLRDSKYGERDSQLYTQCLCMSSHS